MLIVDHSFSSIALFSFALFPLVLDIDRFCMMAMEASSNSRDGLSAASLQLSVEQWELLRRLRNSHLTKAQIIRAYDELDRLDRELGNLFHVAVAPSVDPVSPSTSHTQQISPPPLSHPNNNNNNKRAHNHNVNGLISRSSSTTSNGYQSYAHHSTTSPNLNNRTRNGGNEHNATMANPFEPLSQAEMEEETRELQELLSYVLV